MTFRAIIIDDEQKGIDTLKMLLQMYLSEVKVVSESTRPEEAVALIENYRPEIVFLDINMPELNGFQLLDKLVWREFNLIFTTAHQEFALQALKNNAFDYILKPIDHIDLIGALDKIKKNLEEVQRGKFNYVTLFENLMSQNNQKILINSKSGAEYIDHNEIVFLESNGNYTEINLLNGSLLISTNRLKDLETELCVDGRNFMRVHHSFIVNLKRISRYLKSTENIIMITDQKVPVSKSRKDAFLSWLNL